MAKGLENLSDDQLDKLVLEKAMSQKISKPDDLNDNDLDRLVAEKMLAQADPRDKSNAPQALLEGAAQGLTGGYLPQLQAKMEPITDRLFNLLPGQDAEAAPMSQLYSNDKNYLKSRDENVARQKELAENNPKSFYGGQLLGGVAVGALVPGAKAATTAMRVGQAGGIGLAYGALANPGDVEGIVDEAQLTPRLRNAVLGAITGLGVQGAVETIARYSKPLANKLFNIAKERALKKQAQIKQSLMPQKITGTMRPGTGKELLGTIEESASQIRPSQQTIDANKAYKDLGLEELTPVQMQQKIKGEPTPAQYAETVLKARSPELYNKQLNQFSSLENAVEPFRKLGAPNKETFGASVNQRLDESLKSAGETIGFFKNEIKRFGIAKLSKETRAFDLKVDPSKFEPTEFKQINNYIGRLAGAKKAGEVDNISSLIGAEAKRARAQAGGASTQYERELLIIKKRAEDFIEMLIPEGKPKEAYQQYAKVKNLYNDTLKGALKTGGDDKVLSNITKSAENFNQFKTVAESLKRPDLVSDVKENYLSEIFNQKNWVTAWEKAKKTQVYNEIVPTDVAKKIETLAKYNDQMSSTMTKTVNPSRSGIVSGVLKLARNPTEAPSKILDMIIGDERAFSLALKKYNKILNSDPIDMIQDASDSKIYKMANIINRTKDVADLSQKNPAAFQAMLFNLVVKSERNVKLSSREELKGEDKWTAKGLDKISQENKNIDLSDPKVIEKLLMDKKGEELLKKASDLKPRSRSMSSLMEQIEKHLSTEGKK